MVEAAYISRDTNVMVIPVYKICKSESPGSLTTYVAHSRSLDVWMSFAAPSTFLPQIPNPHDKTGHKVKWHGYWVIRAVGLDCDGFLELPFH